MAIKKYTNGSWVSASYRKYGTETDAITTLPATVIGDSTPISSYTIKGNMEQSGTPTPSSPIYPSECGERTENLLSEKYENRSINGVGAFTIDSNFDLWIGEVVAGQIYTISNINVVYGFFTTKPMKDTGVTYNRSRELEASETAVVTVPSGCTWIAIRVLHNADNAMLNLGSTALPYEPYGYKLPLTLGNTTTNIYLGEVQSTRRIKKLVLTGEETGWIQNTLVTSGNSYVNVSIFTNYKASSGIGYCTHYPLAVTSTATFGVYFGIGINFITNFSEGIDTADKWKTYLQQQYANGTPVTVWYVLAEPATGIVNEPIRKIGDYVDSVSGTGLATSGTTQQFDVGTTLKPSEVDLTYHGWHKHEDTKYST